MIDSYIRNGVREINTYKELINYFKCVQFFGKNGKNKMYVHVEQFELSNNGLLDSFVISVKRVGK